LSECLAPRLPSFLDKERNEPAAINAGNGTRDSAGTQIQPVSGAPRSNGGFRRHAFGWPEKCLSIGVRSSWRAAHSGQKGDARPISAKVKGFMSILTEEQQEIKKATREFVAKRIIPHAAEYDRTGEFHQYLVEAARESKIFAMCVPKQYGGLGYNALSQAVVLEEWGYGCAGMGTTLGVNPMGQYSVLIAGNEEQKNRFFQRIVNGGLSSFALTEPGAGSDVSAGRTTAVRSGDDYVLNGSKCFITNGGYASIYVVYAKTDPSKGVKGISAFIVERERPGFAIGAADHKLGIRSSSTVELLLKDVHVPAANLLGKEGEGMKIAMKTLEMSRPGIAAVALGVAQRALDECVNYVRKRFPDKKVQPGQALQFRLADMQVEVEAARESLHYTMNLRDAGLPYSEDSAITKTFCGDVAMSVTTQAVSLMGSYGYTSVLSKLMRDAKIMQVYEGTNQIQRLVISRELLSPPAPAGQKAA
jgi:alkylation response protein AidB-like acyl-CoA dehydrogenase